MEILSSRFELGQVVGTGGMAKVYRAMDSATGRPVAVKVSTVGADDGAARFDHEVSVLSGLVHPAIVGYVAHGTTDDGRSWLAMDWLDGEDLEARLARGPLDLSEALDLGATVAEALGHVHAHGVVHRDLKPSNVFLRDGSPARATLLDFGIARGVHGARLTRTGGLLGTPGYMAPEQVHGDKPVDARADVFSLGSLLYECITGEPLFKGAGLLAVLAKIVLEPLPPMHERHPQVPPALGDLLARMLAKDPADRPSDARALAEQLRRIPCTAVLSAQARPGPAAVALTTSEQRPVAVILVAASESTPDAPVSGESDTALAPWPGLDGELLSLAFRHGGVCVRLLTGAVAVVLSGQAVATDLVAQAARCALGLRDQTPALAIALAVGRAETAGPQARGSAIDRAAALLASRAPGGQDGAILLDDLEAGLLDAQFDIVAQDGRFLLVGERQPGDQSRTLLGKPTPHVGREAELALLQQLFTRCIEESTAQAVVVTAPAGAGKSRLSQELLHRLRVSNPALSVWIGRGDPTCAGSAFGLLGDAVRSVLDIRGGAPIEVRRERLRVRLEERGFSAQSEAAPQHLVEFLGDLVGVPFPDDDCLPLYAARRDALLMNERIWGAFKRFLTVELARTPTLIVLEDLHWGDGPTIQFLDRALLELRERPLFVLALARPEVSELFPRLWRDRGAHEVRLSPLGRKAVAALVRHALGDAVTDETLNRFNEHSEGNAFYVEELIRWAAAGRQGELPASLVAMVHSRLSALDERARLLLRAASIFGERFWSTAVAALVATDGLGVVEQVLSRLVAKELIVEQVHSRFPTEREFAFRHALLREGAYAMLTDHDSKVGHQGAAQWLESHGEEDSLVLAEHFERGGDDARAATHYLHAAERASVGCDTAAALAFIERGQRLVALDTVRQRLLGMACELRIYDFRLAAAGLADAQALLDMAPPGSLPWSQALMGALVAAAQTGEREVFARSVSLALSAKFAPEATELATILLGLAGAFCDLAGQIEVGNQIATCAEGLVRGEPARIAQTPAAVVFCDIIVASRDYYAREDPWRALLHARRALEGARAIQHRRYILGAEMLSIMNRFFLGKDGAALAEAEPGDMPDHEFGLSSSVRPFLMAWLHADRGTLERGRAWAEHLIATARERRLPLDEARGHWVLAEVLRRAGDLTQSEQAIQRALSMFEVVSALDRPGALATLAHVRLAEGRVDEALAVSEAGMAAYASLGACALFRGSFLRVARAESLLAAGHPDAHSTIVEAEQRLRANSQKIEDPAYREDFLNAVPENRRTLALAETIAGARDSTRALSR